MSPVHFTPLTSLMRLNKSWHKDFMPRRNTIVGSHTVSIDKIQHELWGVVGAGKWLLWYLIIKWLTNLNYFVPLSVLVAAYQWLVCYLLKESAAKLQQELSNGKVVHDPLNFFRLFKWHTLKVGGGWTLGLVVQFHWPSLCHATLRSRERIALRVTEIGQNWTTAIL